MTPDQIQKAIISNGGVMSNHDLINLIDSKDERISACGYDNAASVLRGMWNRGEIKRTMISVVKKSRRKGMYRVYADAWTYETYRHDLPENRW